MDKTEKLKNIYCNLCDFQATRPAEFIRHLKSQKHNRNGKPKSRHCDLCNKDFINSFLYKVHYLTFHATIKEKSKHKHYCRVCNTVYLTEINLFNHIIGRNHLKVIKQNNNIKLEDIAHMQKIYEYHKIKKYFNIDLALLNNQLNDDLQYILNLYN